MFITLEGVDGSGKSTQARKLEEFLTAKGLEVVLTREPGGTDIAEQIREILLNPDNDKMHYATELMLYAAARRQHLEELILPALKRGAWVICDRFSDSTIAYQGYGREIPLEKVEEINRIATEGIKPEVTFIFSLPANVGLERIKAKRGIGSLDRLEAEQGDFYKRVARGFEHIATQGEHRIITIDASVSEEEVFNAMLVRLKDRGMI
ncbi:dTMP kinase [Desulfitispora alkaliphila]|uniref:dTMP kinase n=1 Tax=Desulfitispora alkaliphila TaxID=622674 RepID=UPI003D1EC61E